jgi:polyisoprenoid-binding protein YceI
MNNQFVVPVVEQGRVDAMVVLAISLEVEAGNTETVYQLEPKLRDAFLQVMFDHANVGGFSGTFTDGSNLIVLRTNLKEAAAMILGTVVRDVLITDIARQDS